MLLLWFAILYGLPRWLSGKELPANAGKLRESFDPWVGKIPWKRNGNPLQYSCLGNPMDRGAWQATIHGVTKSQTQLSAHTREHTNTPSSTALVSSIASKWNENTIFPICLTYQMRSSRIQVLKACTQASNYLTLEKSQWAKTKGTLQDHREQAGRGQSSILNLPSYKLENPCKEPALPTGTPGLWISPGGGLGC